MIKVMIADDQERRTSLILSRTTLLITKSCSFENTKEDIIFRIIQETMTNALRHGHASHIEIHLFDEDEKYMIIMQDNGSGCKEIHYGYGLKQMHERVAILNGTIHFYSEEGFRTVVEIPKIGGKKDD